MGGPLAGVTVLELAAIGPAPFAGMILADLGADVLRIDRPPPHSDDTPGPHPDDAPGRPAGTPSRTSGTAYRGDGQFPGDPRHDLLQRGKRSAIIDLRHPGGAAAVRALATRADILLEGFRPGVAERLGVGPDACLAGNPRLVYGRATGWGQDGPDATTAGHDLTYLATSGVLAAVPAPPANLLGDYGGGGMPLAAGVLAALWRSARTGEGQVVDAAIVDGAALLATQLLGLRHGGLWGDPPGTNLLDGGAPFYAVYPAADGRHVAVAALEPAFFAALLAGLGLDPAAVPDQYDRAGWPRLRELLAERIATRTRDAWVAAFAGTDACLAPVLSWEEAARHPQLAARGTFVTADGVPQPAPAPRFSHTPAGPLPGRPPPYPGEHTRAALTDWGVPEVEELIATGVAVQGWSP